MGGWLLNQFFRGGENSWKSVVSFQQKTEMGDSFPCTPPGLLTLPPWRLNIWDTHTEDFDLYLTKLDAR